MSQLEMDTSIGATTMNEELERIFGKQTENSSSNATSYNTMPPELAKAIANAKAFTNIVSRPLGTRKATSTKATYVNPYSGATSNIKRSSGTTSSSTTSSSTTPPPRTKKEIKDEIRGEIKIKEEEIKNIMKQIDENKNIMNGLHNLKLQYKIKMTSLKKQIDLPSKKNLNIEKLNKQIKHAEDKIDGIDSQLKEKREKEQEMVNELKPLTKQLEILKKELASLQPRPIPDVVPEASSFGCSGTGCSIMGGKLRSRKSHTKRKSSAQHKKTLKQKSRAQRGGVKNGPSEQNKLAEQRARARAKESARLAHPLYTLKTPLLPNPPSNAQKQINNAAQALLSMKYGQ